MTPLAATIAHPATADAPRRVPGIVGRARVHAAATAVRASDALSHDSRSQAGAVDAAARRVHRARGVRRVARAGWVGMAGRLFQVISGLC